MNILMTLANPFTNDPRVYNEANSLVKAGHKVTILAWDKSNKYQYKEKINGINVIRSYNSKFMNILPYDIFKLHFWWNKGFGDAIKLFEEFKFDIVHCHDLSSLPIGIKLKKKLGLPLIYDAHEIWGYMIKRDLPKFWANYYLKKEKKLINYADHIITVNDPLKDYFKTITKKSITIIMNCKPLQELEYKQPKNKIFTLLYIGTISKSRFLIELVDVVKKITQIKCIIGGIGSKHDYIESLKKSCLTSKNVEFLGKIPMENVLSMTKNADVIVCMTSPNDPNNSRASANKQFEAMVCGRPIICTKNTYPGIITEQEKCGIVVDYNKDSLKKGIKNLFKNNVLCIELGKNALNAAIRRYNWEKQDEKLVEIYEIFCK